MTTATSRPTTTRLHEFLKLDHERIDHLLEDLLQVFARGDADALRDAWTRFEAGLQGHLVAEERYMLPLLRASHPAEADALTAQHEGFRRALAELGVGTDLRLVKLDVAQDLVRDLREHAAREEAFLYDWADRELGPEARDLVRGAVSAPPAS
jgi:hypothetical protein